MHQTDVVIIGGGIVGLATAYQLTRQFPQRQVVLLEKEPQFAQHQSGHNSGVLHSGIYYRPGTLKARNCRLGKAAMENFCRAEGIDFQICGKVIVAVGPHELPALEELYRRGQANGVRCEMIDTPRLHELEPHAAAIKAIHVPEAGIVDFRQVCRRLVQHVEQAGGQIVCNARVRAMQVGQGEVVVQSDAGDFQTRYVVNCTGLHSDRVTTLSGEKPDVRIIPFRGEFFEIKPAAHHFCRALIYRVPDPKFPFLGVHFTRTIAGRVECGPNAVLAFSREGYRRRDVRIADLWGSLSYPGFWKLGRRYWKTGLGEMWRSVSKAAFVRALQELVPEIQAGDLVAAPAGVRAMAVTRDGQLVDDFVIRQSRRVVNVCNAPSPAATASLNIGRLIVEKLAAQWD